MNYVGDFALESTFDVKFTSRKFTTGAPFALASGVISAYVGNSTTQLTAGITLSADFDSVTGLNNVRVVATAANGYATASNYQLVITTGTVDSVSVVGEVIAQFSIEARSPLRPTVANRTLGVEASGKATGVVLADTVTTYTGNTPQTGDVFPLASTEIADIKAKTDNLPSDPADASVIAALIAAVEAKVDIVDTVADAIKAKTDNLPTDPADQSLVIAATNTILADTNAILVDTAEIGAAGAGLTALSTQTSVNDLPTNAELATAFGTADDAVLTQVALVKTKTDSLTFGVANVLNVNIKRVNDVVVNGDGGATSWGP